MTYSNGFVLSVCVNGVHQTELANNVVKLPFGSEYSLRLRNRNDRRALVKIYIDGENVSGNGYVIPANDVIELKRHSDKDRAFKFVSLDSGEAADFGKDGPNEEKKKGLVEAHYWLEKEYPKPPQVVHHHHDHYHPYPQPVPMPYPVPVQPWIRPQPMWGTYCGTRGGSQNIGGQHTNSSNMGFAGGSSANYSADDLGCVLKDCDTENVSPSPREELKTCTAPKDDIATFKRISLSSMQRQKSIIREAPPAVELKDGCTVEGNSTGQTFGSTWIEVEDTATVLKLFLQGWEEEKDVEVAGPRKTNKQKRIDDLEAENEALRQKLAEEENKRLKEELEKKAKPKAKPKKKPLPKRTKKGPVQG